MCGALSDTPNRERSDEARSHGDERLVTAGASSLIARCALRHRSLRQFSATSIIGGAVGYTTVAVLTAGSIAPGHPPRERWRRQLQRAGHNVFMGMHAFTIGYGYLQKGRNARAYAPLAALWLAAARGMAYSWRG